MMSSTKPSETEVESEQASPWTYLQKTYSQSREMHHGSSGRVLLASEAGSQSQAQVIHEEPEVRLGTARQLLTDTPLPC